MLQAPVVARSVHFVVHHQATPLPTPFKPPRAAVVQDFSTETTPLRPQIVDNLADQRDTGPRILGIMVPKRHAKRAATRNLIKRQVRAVMQARTELAGAWLVRLRQPINRQTYPSAASDALRVAVRAELLTLLTQLPARAPA